MNYSKLIIICFIMIVAVDSRPCYKYFKKRLSNIQRSVYIKCNKIAYNKTNNSDIYNCINNKNTTCNILDNYNDYNTIRNECIKTHINECNMAIVYVLILWVFLAICYNTTNYK